MEFVIDVHAFAFHQGVRAEVAVPTTLVRQRHQTRRQQFVLVVRLLVVVQYAARKRGGPAARRSEMSTFSRIAATASPLTCGLSAFP